MRLCGTTSIWWRPGAGWLRPNRPQHHHWAAARLGIAHGHDYLNRCFFDALFREGRRRIGVDTLAGELRLYRTTSAAPFYDLIDTYIVFGEPALQINSQTNNLSVALSADSQTLGSDAVVTYANAGPTVASRVVLTLTLPGGWQDVQWQSSTWVTHTRSAPDVWLLGDLPASSRRQLVIWGRTKAGTIYAEASIGGSGKDSNPGDNRVALPTTTVQALANLSIKWQDWSQTPILPRQPRTFILKYRNNGSGTAPALRLTLALPAPLTILGLPSGPQLWPQ